MQEFLKSINWPTAIAAVVIALVAMWLIGRM